MAVVIKGAKELAVKLQKLSGKQAKKILRKGLRAATKVVAAAAKTLVPVASGELKRSIKTRAMKRKRGRIGFKVTTRTKYSMAQEYGFQHYKGKQHVAGQEYMQTAGQSKEEQAINIVDNAVEEAIRSSMR